MSNMYATCTVRKQAYLAYVCSKCGWPMIASTVIEGKSSKSYTDSLSESPKLEARKIADATAEAALEGITDNINIFYQTRKPQMVEANLAEKIHRMTVGDTIFDVTISPGYTQSAVVNNIGVCCPRCKNKETWLNLALPEEMAKLKKDNFPSAFLDSNDALKWVKRKIISISDSIAEKRKDVKTVDEATQEVRNILSKIKLCKNEINNFPEVRTLTVLKSELTTYEGQLHRTSILNFSVKNKLKEKIAVLNLQISDIDKIVKEKTDLTKARITQLELELTHAQLIAFDQTDDIKCIEDNHNFSYYIVPNEIPCRFLTESECAERAEPEADGSSSCDSPVFCRRCGNKLPKGSLFCPKCGAKIN